jgi:hypothetical protein
LGNRQTDGIPDSVLHAYLNPCSPELEFRDKFEGAGWVLVAEFDTQFVYIDLLAEGPEKSCFFADPILEPETQATVPGWSRVENKYGRVYYQHGDSGLITYQHPSTSEDIDQITGQPKQYFTGLLDRRLSLNDPLHSCQLSRRLFSEDPQTGQIRYSGKQWAQAVGMTSCSSNQNEYDKLPRRVLSETSNSHYEYLLKKRSKQYRPNSVDSPPSVAMDGEPAFQGITARVNQSVNEFWSSTVRALL